MGEQTGGELYSGRPPASAKVFRHQKKKTHSQATILGVSTPTRLANSVRFISHHNNRVALGQFMAASSSEDHVESVGASRAHELAVCCIK